MASIKNYAIAILSLLSVACSHQALYDTIQANERQACQKLLPSQYEDCIRHTEKPYAKYEKEREEVLGKWAFL